jgi:5-methylthioribose kinase
MNLDLLQSRHPDLFLLRHDQPETLDTYLRSVGWLAADDAVLQVERAGEGNMNCTVRARTRRGSFVVKQSRPWVEKYPQFAAPWDRACREREFYAAVAGVAGVGDRMPRLLHADEAMRLLVLEDLGEGGDVTDLYRGPELAPAELDALADFLGNLHRLGVNRIPAVHSTADVTDCADGGAEPPSPIRVHGSTSQVPGPLASSPCPSASSAPSAVSTVFSPVKDPDRLKNREMRALNHAHIFIIPWQPGGGPDLELISPGLAEAARGVQSDRELASTVERVGREIYLADGTTLIHGDFFPGSLIRTAAGLRVIDPEFGFVGRAEFDVGVWWAHLLLAGQSAALLERWAGVYRKPPGFDVPVACRLAGIEMVRRLIGYAQLPLGCNAVGRLDRLEVGVGLVREPGWERLMQGGRRLAAGRRVGS